MALSDYQALVTSLVRDDTGKFASGDRDTAIALAVQRYSKDRPQTVVEDVVAAADGNLIPLPAGWDPSFSELLSLEFPLNQVPSSLIEKDCWQFYKTPSATEIMLLDSVTSGDTIRATYTLQQLLDATGPGHDTIPLKHREAVASYAASIGLGQLASLFAGDSDSTIQASMVNPRSKAQDYAARAKVLAQAYFDALGINPKAAVPAGVSVALDPRGSLGQTRLTHRLVRGPNG